MLPVCAFGLETENLTVETAYKSGTNFVKKDTEYYALNSYVKGVLGGYTEAKYKTFFSQDEVGKILTCKEQIEYATSQVYECLSKNFKGAEFDKVYQYFSIFENYQNILDMKQCLLSQIPEHALTRVFYAYVEGKVSGSTLLSKAIIDETENYCFTQMQQKREKSLEAKNTTPENQNTH